MPNPPNVPVTPATSQKKTIVAATPPPPVNPAPGVRSKPRGDAGEQQAASAPTLAAVHDALGSTDPGRDAAQASDTVEDFQASRHKHTHMAGIENLSEPGADQPRIRLVPGKVVPGTRYRILRWLGEGGMGVVYEAEHIDIERRVALKILRFDLSQEAKMAQVFRDEARAASRIGSKNIVEIYDFGELSDGRLFFCMEMLAGHDLVPASEEDWIEPPRLIGLLRQVCKGLSAAHKSGIVHRDIKPENIILVNQDGREVVKIVDFGISAMLAVGQDDGTTIAGTPHYMAPEQITGEKFDGRLDIYSVGCMAYELLVGYPPFLADAIQELLQQQLYVAPKSIKECRPDREIPPALADVVMKCLAKKPEQRWASMDDLEAALCEAQIAAKLTTPWDDLPLPEVEAERRDRLVAGMPNPNAIVIVKGRSWVWPVVAGAAALVLGVGITWALVGGKPTEAEIDQIEALTTEARTAASKTQWVYPPNDEPEAPTAFQKIVALEALEGGAEKAGDERGAELRDEFSNTLTVLGDRYWEVPEARGFAREYYAMALLFDPEDKQARERSGLTPAMLADFQDRASRGEFTEAELSAARWLDVLAEEDKTVAAQKADELLAMETEAAKTKKGSAGSLLVQSRALDAARGAGIAVAAPAPEPLPEPVPEPEPEPVPEPEPELIEDTGETEGAVVEEPKPGKKPGKKPKNDDEALGSNAADPEKAAELAEQGMAALSAGRRTEASSLFNQAISYDNRNAMALMGLSQVYFDTGSNQKAVLYAEKAVKAAPKNSNYRIQLGDAYFKVLRYRDALEQYEKAKELGSSKAEARIQKAKEKIGG
jgi:tetratricopeptide (TPR) repeat protein